MASKALEAENLVGSQGFWSVPFSTLKTPGKRNIVPNVHIFPYKNLIKSYQCPYLQDPPPPYVWMSFMEGP